VQAHTATSGSYRASIFAAITPSAITAASINAGNPLVTITGSNTGNDFTLGISSYLGVSSATPVAQNQATASTAAWASGTVAAGAGNLLFGGAAADVGGTSRSSTATGGTERIDFYSATSGGVVTLVDKLSAAASDSLTGTWSAAFSHVGIAAAFPAAAVGAGSLPIRRDPGRGLILRR
jgi:hypothetical protein